MWQNSVFYWRSLFVKDGCQVKQRLCSWISFSVDFCNSDIVCSLISELTVIYYLDKFQASKFEQKFMQNEMRLESTAHKYLSCAAIHSAAYFLPCGFASGLQKNCRGAFKDRRVSVYRWLTYNALTLTPLLLTFSYQMYKAVNIY
jgi:hypothetical protein